MRIISSPLLLFTTVTVEFMESIKKLSPEAADTVAGMRAAHSRSAAARAVHAAVDAADARGPLGEYDAAQIGGAANGDGAALKREFDAAEGPAGGGDGEARRGIECRALSKAGVYGRGIALAAVLVLPVDALSVLTTLGRPVLSPVVEPDPRAGGAADGNKGKAAGYIAPAVVIGAS